MVPAPRQLNCQAAADLATVSPMALEPGGDAVNHPPHYNLHPSGIECIEIVRLLPFNVGNAVKYVWRTDHRNGVQDLEKALWYLTDVAPPHLDDCAVRGLDIPVDAAKLLYMAAGAERATSTDEMADTLAVECAQIRGRFFVHVAEARLWRARKELETLIKLLKPDPLTQYNIDHNTHCPHGYTCVAACVECAKIGWTIEDYAARVERVHTWLASHLDHDLDLDQLAGVACFRSRS